mmetsp:Transcript_26482/g.86844  ORF Transcript_26482/g.86844 Transcript_26482/m.86844 type:complete len:277 (-) Transcript_26482:130-960(-)
MYAQAMDSLDELKRGAFSGISALQAPGGASSLSLAHHDAEYRPRVSKHGAGYAGSTYGGYAAQAPAQSSGTFSGISALHPPGGASSISLSHHDPDYRAQPRHQQFAQAQAPPPPQYTAPASGIAASSHSGYYAAAAAYAPRSGVSAPASYGGSSSALPEWQPPRMPAREQAQPQQHYQHQHHHQHQNQNQNQNHHHHQPWGPESGPIPTRTWPGPARRAPAEEAPLMHATVHHPPLHYTQQPQHYQPSQRGSSFGRVGSGIAAMHPPGGKSSLTFG